MRTSKQIISEIEQRFGFVPPFFEPARQNPLVLENLWQQTLSAYLDSPLPALFKEKLSAYLSRYCAVPYCLICHSCTLRPLGLQAYEVLTLIESPPPTEPEIEAHLSVLAAQSEPLKHWPESGSALEVSLLNCSIVTTLDPDRADPCHQEMRRVLDIDLYQTLIAFIAYVKSCHIWVEAHPDIAYEADRRAQEHLGFLLEAEPQLAGFFCNYQTQVRQERQNRAAQMAALEERRRAELQLRQSEEKFRQLAENIREVIWMTSPDCRELLYINSVYETLWGRSRESLYANPRSWLDAVEPPEKRDYLRTCLKTQADYDEEYCIRRPDGSVRWIRDRAFPVQNEAGEVYRLVGIAEDITERKQIEQETQFLSSMTQAIFKSPDFDSALEIALQKVCESAHWDLGEAWVPLPDRTALKCSPAWYSKTDSLLEFRRGSETLLLPIGVGIPGRVGASKSPEWCPDVSTASNATYLRSHLAQAAELKAALGMPLIANNEVIAVLVFYMFEARSEDKRLIELISAATELGLFVQRKQAEEEVRQLLETEQELNQLKSNFISMVSHELRTPLTSILMAAELLECYESIAPEKKRRYFERIRSSTKRMTQLLEDVLLITRGERDKLEYNPIPLNLEEFCDELVAEWQASAGDRYTLTFVCGDRFPEARMDINLLQHIFSNLISNAIKYSPQGGTVRFELSQQDERAVFRIQDSGIGIPAADQQHVFEFFHRATNVAQIPGTGLGLAIVKQCIDLHGGQISVESTVGIGTTFTVNLPYLASHPLASTV